MTQCTRYRQGNQPNIENMTIVQMMLSLAVSLLNPKWAWPKMEV